MKEYIGVDLGKRKAVVVKKDRRGRITEKATLPVTQAAVEAYFSKQDPRSEVVVEASIRRPESNAILCRRARMSD